METYKIQGRQITDNDIELIRRLMDENPSWHRTRLSQELCRLWEWQTPTGQPKDMAARSLLRKLDSMGCIVLPHKQMHGAEVWGNASRSTNSQLSLPLQCEVPEPIVENLDQLRPLHVVIAENVKERALFKETVQQYHYLELSRSVGQNLQYLVYDQKERLLACLLFGAAAWRCADRDLFIGWSDETRAQRLAWVADNARFLILPHVQTPHLASHVLGKIMRRIRYDWYVKYSQPIVLIETFVDQSRFAGTCYKAANWICVGRTQGRSRNDRERKLSVPIKSIYLYPLVKNAREVLSR